MKVLNIFDKITKLVNEGLEIDFKYVLIQLSALLILFIVVKIFLWKPITNYLEKKREVMVSNLTEAAKNKEESERLLKNAQIEYETAKKESKKIIKDAIDIAEKEKEDILLKAKDLADKRVNEAIEDANKIKNG